MSGAPGMENPNSLENDVEALKTQYQHRGDSEELEESNSLGRQELSLHPMGLPIRSSSLSYLANYLFARYEKLGDMEDLAESLLVHREALARHPVGHPDRASSLSNLGVGLNTRYNQLGNIKDLEESISLHCEALNLCPVGHPLRASSLSNLGVGFNTRYNQLGNIKDLEESISLHCEALNLCPVGHPLRASSLSNLGDALNTRYNQLGNIKDLEESISLHCEAVSLHPVGHPLRASSLSKLGVSLNTRYNQSGDIKDLEESISLYCEALSLHPVGHPCRASSLSSLGVGLHTRYNQSGNIKDLEESISLDREALTLRPIGHPDRASSLSKLGVGLRTRYNQSGNIKDLEESISLDREAVSLHPVGHPRRASSLSKLGVSLNTRYNQSGDIKDLEESISLYCEAVSLRPVGHPRRASSLSSLGVGLSTRCNQLGNIKDLEESISLHCKALNLCPVGHPHRALSLSNLANCLTARYTQSGNIKDLEESISLYHEALSLCPIGHPDRATSLSNLGVGLSTRYNQSGNIKDLEVSISLGREALSLYPAGHPFCSRSFQNLAIHINALYKYTRNPEDLQEMFTCYERAANDPTSYLKYRLSSAIGWTSIARRYRHQSILNAYTITLHLVHHSLIFRPDVQAQQMFLATSKLPPALASDAASAAIGAGNLELAVEFLEQGRAVLWSKTDAYKSPLEQLRQTQGGARLADELETLSAELECLVLSSNTLDASPSPTHSLDARMKLYRVRSEEWESLVQRIRQMDGFTHFLRTPPFQTLQTAARDGPVILINISKYRSDAIILTINNAPNLIPLTDVEPSKLCKQVDQLTSSRGVISVLRYLWHTIVEPVVSRLKELGVKRKSRIWWCPTATLCALPLHAAGPYRRREPNLPDLYTCSYTSTLSSLIRARSNIVQLPRVPKLLVVGQPHALRNVGEEVGIIAQYAGIVSQVLLGAEATHEAVLDSLQRHSWVHFACHGHLGDDDQPFQASFELFNNRRLTLLELIRKRVPHGECAFLAACHSAAGDSRTPDESIHLSAALQFCGFRSVVGTLWEMDDEDGPIIAKEFYKYMFRNPERIDFRDSANALSSAIQAMRDAGLPPERWVMFIHIGA